MDLVVYCHNCDNYRFNSIHDDRRCYTLPKRLLTLLSDVEFDCFNRWYNGHLPPMEEMGWVFGKPQGRKSKFIQETKIIEPEWEPEGFEGGWFEAGKIEISLLFGAILLGVHSIALNGADNRQQAGFIMIILAMCWTLAASWQLQKALISENESELARKDVGLEPGSEVAYSDDEETAGLLVDKLTGHSWTP